MLGFISISPIHFIQPDLARFNSFVRLRPFWYATRDYQARRGMGLFRWNPFSRNKQPAPAGGIRPREVVRRDGEVIVDVSGQTCPGYLLAIHNAVDPLPKGARIKLLITYPPCGDDVSAWCKARDIELLDVANGGDGTWIISLLK
jgi:TusA-related sulfurtransferase